MLFCGKTATSAKKGLRDLNIVKNHEQLKSSQPAPPAHPTRLAHPAGRARAEEGTWEAAERKGKDQNAKNRKKKKKFAMVVKNAAQKGQERKQRVRNTRQTELFG